MIGIKEQIIKMVAKVLLGSQLWNTARSLVSQVAESGLTGPEKRDAVQKDLVHLFKDVGLSLVNLAIELGVAYLAVTQPAASAVVAPLAASAEKAIQKEIDKD